MQPEANQNTENTQQLSDKELNFRALENKYKRALEEERNARIHAENAARESLERKNQQVNEEDDDDDDDYVNKKKLTKKLQKFGEQTKKETQSEIQKAVQIALHEEKKQNWLKNNDDFYDVLNKHADEFARLDPELAETILNMPEGFERQKLVYKNIKALGLHKPKEDSSIQKKIDANKRGPFYQPSNQGTAPYAGVQADYSDAGKKNAYQKMLDLKKRLRLG